jgi:thiol:disulfide interchange protein DsbD
MMSCTGIKPTWLAGVLLGLSLALLAGSSLSAPVQVQVLPRSELAEIGKELVLDIVITPAPGERILVAGLAVTVDTGEARVLDEPYPLVIQTQPSAADQAAYEGPVRLEWAAPVPPDIAATDFELKVTVSAATSGGAVETGLWTTTMAAGYGEDWSADKITDFINRRGLPLFLAVVFGFGILMSLSPCIYPMIPITLAVIGAQSQEKGALHGLVMSVTYVVGMAFVYAILGALSATVFSGITAFMQSPAVVVPLALLLVALAFSMFGAFELQAPAFLRDRLQGPGGSNRGGLFGVFAMGMVAGLVASPCVGPFLAALLVWVATTGNWVLGFLSLFTFGIGMGLLLIGVGTFPALLGSMPQSGGWMDTVKKGMGLLLIAMAFYFVRPEAVLPPHIFFPLVGLTAILTAVFMGAFDSLPPEAPWWPRASKGLGLAVFTAGIFLLLGSFLMHGFLMPSPLAGLARDASGPATVAVGRAAEPVTATAVADAAPLPAKVPWTIVRTGENVQSFLDEARATAKASGKPVMIDFWAQWCVYCKKLDKLVWNVPAVVEESLRFVTIKIDATDPDDDEMAAIKEEFEVPGLPRVIFIDSRGEVLLGRSVGFESAEKMLEIMKSIR